MDIVSLVAMPLATLQFHAINSINTVMTPAFELCHWHHFCYRGKGKVKVKVKLTLVQALRLCTGRTAHRGSRGIALLFHDLGTRGGQRHTPAALYMRARHSTHYTGGWVGPRAGLDLV